MRPQPVTDNTTHTARAVTGTGLRRIQAQRDTTWTRFTDGQVIDTLTCPPPQLPRDPGQPLHGKHSASDLFHAAHDVITQLRVVAESRPPHGSRRATYPSVASR
jgi:hypothetical protein